MLDLDEIATTLDTLPNALRVLLAPFDEATLTARPAPGEWCVLEVVGHLITCDTGAFRDRVETIIAGADQVPAFDAGRALDPPAGVVSFSEPSPSLEPSAAVRSRTGTGSYPFPPHGWHRRILRSAIQPPFPAPCTSIASLAYAEHVGV